MHYHQKRLSFPAPIPLPIDRRAQANVIFISYRFLIISEFRQVAFLCTVGALHNSVMSKTVVEIFINIFTLHQ